MRQGRVDAQQKISCQLILTVPLFIVARRPRPAPHLRPTMSKPVAPKRGKLTAPPFQCAVCKCITLHRFRIPVPNRCFIVARMQACRESSNRRLHRQSRCNSKRETLTRAWLLFAPKQPRSTAGRVAACAATHYYLFKNASSRRPSAPPLTWADE